MKTEEEEEKDELGLCHQGGQGRPENQYNLKSKTIFYIWKRIFENVTIRTNQY